MDPDSEALNTSAKKFGLDVLHCSLQGATEDLLAELSTLNIIIGENAISREKE